eukprot:jgi/Chrzof1/10991/Cz05g19240.t1
MAIFTSTSPTVRNLLLLDLEGKRIAVKYYSPEWQQVDKKTVLENLDLVLLTIDEIVDGGLILETEPQMVASRVSMRGADGEVPLTEQTFSQAFASAKEHIARSLLK